MFCLIAHGCERATPRALPAGWASRPPDPLQMMFVSGFKHRCMLLVCRELYSFLPRISARKHRTKRSAYAYIESGFPGAAPRAGLTRVGSASQRGGLGAAS